MIGALLGAGYISVLALKRALTLQYASRERSRFAARDRELPGTTIVQAVLSGDPQLEATLEYNVDLLHTPAFVWVLDEDDREGRIVCGAIVERHPHRDITVVLTPPPPPDNNPKLFKLERARSAIATASVIVLDDDTVLSGEGFDALLAAAGTHAIATGLPSYRPGTNIPSSLVAHFVNDNSACTYLAACRMSAPITINGMCYAMRTEVLETMGGFAPLVHSLADDLAMARAVRAQGGTIYQTPWPHVTATTVRDAGHYWSLMHRWFLFASLLIRTEAPSRSVPIVAFYLLPSIALGALVLRTAWRRKPSDAALLLAVLLARGRLLRDVRRRTLGTIPHHWLGSVVAELALPVHAAHAFVNRTIRWRSRSYRVRNNDAFAEIV